MTEMTEMMLEYRVREDAEHHPRPAGSADGPILDIATLVSDDAPELDGLVPADEAARPLAGTRPATAVGARFTPRYLSSWIVPPSKST